LTTQNPLQVQVAEATAHRTLPPIRRRPDKLPAIVVLLVVSVLAPLSVVFAHRSLVQQADAPAALAVEAAQRVFARETLLTERSLQAQAGVVADDARIRAALATPDIDAATLSDLLGDLKTNTTGTILAILSQEGVVRAAVGDAELQGLDLASSRIVQACVGAEGGAASSVWTYNSAVMHVGAAQVRLGPVRAGMLLIARPIVADDFAGLGTALGVHGAMAVGDRAVLHGGTGPSLSAIQAALRAGTAVPGFVTKVAQVPSAPTVRTVWMAEGGSFARFLTTYLVLIGLAGLACAVGVLLLWYVWRWQ
jgi:hypothetical protein